MINNPLEMIIALKDALDDSDDVIEQETLIHNLEHAMIEVTCIGYRAEAIATEEWLRQYIMRHENIMTYRDRFINPPVSHYDY